MLAEIFFEYRMRVDGTSTVNLVPFRLDIMKLHMHEN